MSYFWLALTICWLSTLIFAWSVIRLHHNPRPKPRLHTPPDPPQAMHNRQIQTPEELLRGQFVAGEITAEEYERLLDILLRTTQPTIKSSNTAITGRADTPRIAPHQRQGIDRRTVLILLASSAIGMIVLSNPRENSPPDHGYALVATMMVEPTPTPTPVPTDATPASSE